MNEVMAKLLPIFIAFGLALVAKRFGVLRQKDGDRLLKVIFYLTIPPLVFVSVVDIRFDSSLLLFPLLPPVIVAASYLAAKWMARSQYFDKGQKGIFRAAPMMLNTGMPLTFLLAVYGGAGATRVVLFNVLNNPMIFVWSYMVLASHGSSESTAGQTVRRVLGTPALWALCLGVLWNIFSLPLPGALHVALQGIGDLTRLLIVIALGLVFSPRRLRLDSAIAAVMTRAIVGLLVGTLVVWALGLTGINRAAVLLLALSPVGFNLLTFVAREGQDEAYAANIVSYSLGLFLLVAPLILILCK